MKNIPLIALGTWCWGTGAAGRPERIKAACEASLHDACKIKLTINSYTYTH